MNKDFEEISLSSKLQYDGKIITVFKDEVKLSNNSKSFREVVRHSGGVVILAQQQDSFLLVKQFRYPVASIMLELPAGKLDKINEDILTAAKRELLEETGHIAKVWKSLGFIYPSAGFCDEKLYLFYATELTFIGEAPDEDEIIQHKFYTKDEIFKMIKSGEINDAKTICAFMRYGL